MIFTYCHSNISDFSACVYKWCEYKRLIFMGLNPSINIEMMFHITKWNFTIRYCLSPDDYPALGWRNFIIGTCQ